MSVASIVRTRVLPAVATCAVAGLLAAAAWYGYRALAARPIERIYYGGDAAKVPPRALETLARSLHGVASGDVSLAVVRDAARRLPWVREASVRRRFPDGLEITFEAHEAFARWGQDRLVSDKGAVFDGATDAKLPRFDGPEGSGPRMVQEYPEIRRLLEPLASPVSELHLSPRGAWEVVLDNGLTLEVGRGDVEARLERFARAWPGLVAAQVQTRHADLRYANGFALRRVSEVAPGVPPVSIPKKTQAKPRTRGSHRP